MVQMQNLKSSSADMIFASGQSNMGDYSSDKSKSSDFMDILMNVGSKSNNRTDKETVNSSDSETSVKDSSRDNSAADNKSSLTDKSDAKNDANDSSNMIDNKDADVKDEDVSSESASLVAGAEMLAIMAATSQPARTLQSSETMQVSSESLVSADAVAGENTLVTEQLVTASENVTVNQQTASEKIDGVEYTSLKSNITDESMQSKPVLADTETAAAQKPVNSENEGVTIRLQNTDEAQNSKLQGSQSTQSESQNANSGNQKSGTDAGSSAAVKTELTKKNDDGIVVESQTVMADAPKSVADSNFTVVKVSEGDTLQQEVPVQVADTIVAKISEGTQEFEITLNPEELGKIQIKIVFENGKAQVFMTASEKSTQNALMANTEAIKQIIENGTNQKTSVIVENPGDKMSNYEEQQNREGNSQNRQKNENRGGSEAEMTSFIQQLRLGLIEEEAV